MGRAKKKCDRVVFRRWSAADGGGVIALFPDQPEGRGRVNSYEHVGQHGGADYHGVVGRTKPAKPDEYRNLLQELKHIGYAPCVRKRS
jgi:hypothetical protein